MMHNKLIIILALINALNPSCCTATNTNGSKFGLGSVRTLAISAVTPKTDKDTNPDASSRNVMFDRLIRVGSISISCIGMSILAPILLVATEALGKDSVSCIKAAMALSPSAVTSQVLELMEQKSIVTPVTLAGKEHKTTLVLSFPAQCLLFGLASMEAFSAIIADNNNNALKGKITPGERLKEVASDIISFWKISPRELFAIGAGLRALQLCTSLQYSFDPSVGVAALINIGATLIKFRWIPQLVVGWTITPNLWKLCGARPPTCPEQNFQTPSQ